MANKIKAVLTEQKKSTKWLAEQVGKSSCTVGKWCNNQAQPNPEMLEAVAKALNVPAKDLVEC